jgi:hypothetical protein
LNHLGFIVKPAGPPTRRFHSASPLHCKPAHFTLLGNVSRGFNVNSFKY